MIRSHGQSMTCPWVWNEGLIHAAPYRVAARLAMSEIEVPDIKGYTQIHTDPKGARTVFPLENKLTMAFAFPPLV